MIETFDYYMNSVVPIRSGSRQIVDMSGPRYHRLIGFGDIPFLFPSHTEPYETTREYLEFAGLKEGNTVLDIGAHTRELQRSFSRSLSLPKGTSMLSRWMRQITPVPKSTSKWQSG
jgi:hypothetical protein